MIRWWRGAALIGSLIVAATASAQSYLHSPHGAARIPEPIPCADVPNLVPGPLPPEQAPRIPTNCDLTLPANHSNAYPCEELPPEKAFYFHVGTQALQRERLNSMPLAVLDGQNLDTGVATNTSPNAIFNTNQLAEVYNFGVSATAGILLGDRSIEASGYYITDLNRQNGIRFPGQIDSFFTNPPLGFEGNNGLWLQADRMFLRKDSRFGNAELNYRVSSSAFNGFELIYGVRYVDVNERINLVTDDDGVLFPTVSGGLDPTNVATYLTQTNNRILAPQLGFEWTFINPDHIHGLHWFPFTAGVSAKGAWGVNFAETDTRLERGDGRIGFDGGRVRTQFSHLYDIGCFVDVHVLERLRFRFGYNVMFLLNMALADEQIDFNLANTNGRADFNGNLFYHGPSVEIQFLF